MIDFYHPYRVMTREEYDTMEVSGLYSVCHDWDDAGRTAIWLHEKEPKSRGLMAEVDPNGKRPDDPGAKLDAGKNRLGLVLFGFARALQAVGEVGTYGANKYTDNGWEQVPDGERRYTDALLRHLLREASGELSDPDTGFLHAAHTAWNALARLDLTLRQTLR